jgi:hypothetical protein
LESQLKKQQKNHQQNTKQTLQEPVLITTKELEHKKILCVIPSLPSDFNLATLRSILQQTIPVDMIVILPRKAEGISVGEKVSKVLNEGFSYIKLENFDYILRLDGDVVVPANFLEENLKGKPDKSGSAGYEMLIKVKPFMELMNGKLHPKSDDSYIGYKFMQKGLKVVKNQVNAVLLRQAGKHHGTKYFFNRGKEMYKLGYEPIHVLTSLRWELWNLFAIFGFFVALLKQEEKYDVADFVWHKQLRRLFSLDIGYRL